MFLQNATEKNVLFNLHFINFSIHFEMRSLKKNLSYLLIYKFNAPPQLTNSINDTNGWSLFCSSNTTEEIYTYFIDNHQTVNRFWYSRINFHRSGKILSQ
jgi:hypothetical protein